MMRIKSLKNYLSENRIFGWIPAVLWACVIFAFSAQNAEESTGTSRGFIKWIVGLLSGAVPADGMDRIYELTEFYVRKAAHFSIYFLLGILVYYAVRKYNNSRKPALSVMICFLYSITDEVHQYFVPGRSCRVMDVFIDTAGSAVGVCIFLLAAMIFSKIVDRNKT